MNEKQTIVSKEVSSAIVRPTKKQKALLAYIEVFIIEHGYSPSYREIMNGLEYTSVATVALHVGNLISRGHLRKRDHSARSLEVVNPTSEASVTLPTNQLKPTEEKWLVNKFEQLLKFAEADTSPETAQEQLSNLYILLNAMQILGSTGAAQSFVPRLSVLKKLQSEKIM
jgi:SOS-response transcriptional repressor LexA